MRPHESLPALSQDEAIEWLQIHSFAYHDIHDPRVGDGFLGSLRPYQGTLKEGSFHELMACIKTLGPGFAAGELVNRQVIGDFWRICQLARAWAIQPEGMLRRNHLIEDSDVERMEDWLDCISYAVMMFLEGSSAVEAFEPYDFYVDDQESELP